jgi:ABC-type dipeptide/oligopeptide/nickel transport system permease subunit
MDTCSNDVTFNDATFNDVIEEELLPPVNELKRFIKVFFKRKVVIAGFALIVLILIVAALADIIAPFDPYEQDLHNTLANPNGANILGTDALGRDLLSRVIHGTRVALAVGVSTVLVSAAVGTIIGLIAGYAEGFLQSVIMRLTDALMAIPPLILAIIVATILNVGVPGVVLAMAITLLPGYIRLINGQVMSLKQNDYVLAAETMGAKSTRVLLRHILPNCLSPLIVQMTMMMGVSILTEASLSFLGLGIKPPTAAWGSLAYDGYKYLLTKPLLSIVPGLAVMALAFSFNMVGDGLRDALDPKLRGTSS